MIWLWCWGKFSTQRIRTTPIRRSGVRLSTNLGVIHVCNEVPDVLGPPTKMSLAHNLGSQAHKIFRGPAEIQKYDGLNLVVKEEVCSIRELVWDVSLAAMAALTMRTWGTIFFATWLAVQVSSKNCWASRLAPTMTAYSDSTPSSPQSTRRVPARSTTTTALAPSSKNYAAISQCLSQRNHVIYE